MIEKKGVKNLKNDEKEGEHTMGPVWLRKSYTTGAEASYPAHPDSKRNTIHKPRHSKKVYLPNDKS